MYFIAYIAVGCVGFLSLLKPSYIHEIIIVLLFNFDGNKSKKVHYVQFEVSLAATMQFTVFWDVKPCSLVDVNQYRCRLQIMWWGGKPLWPNLWYSSERTGLKVHKSVRIARCQVRHLLNINWALLTEIRGSASLFCHVL